MTLDQSSVAMLTRLTLYRLAEVAANPSAATMSFLSGLSWQKRDVGCKKATRHFANAVDH